MCISDRCKGTRAFVYLTNHVTMGQRVNFPFLPPLRQLLYGYSQQAYRIVKTAVELENFILEEYKAD